MSPPVTLLSSPMIAFCTVLEMVEQDDEVERVELRQLAFARQPQADDQKHVDDDRAEDLLGDRQAQDEHVVRIDGHGGHPIAPGRRLRVSGAGAGKRRSDAGAAGFAGEARIAASSWCAAWRRQPGETCRLRTAALMTQSSSIRRR